MTTIKNSATEGVRTLDVIVRDDGLVNLSIGQVGSSCGIQIRKYELLEALDAVAKASPWGELQEDYGRVVRELREARAELVEAEATIERVGDVMNEFYKVRGDWHSWTGANALKASLEAALDPKPAFELPTEAGMRFAATSKSNQSTVRFESVAAFGSIYFMSEASDMAMLAWTADEVMSVFTDHRLLDKGAK